MPVGDVLVGNAGSNVKHDDAALTVDVVAISETTELLLTGGVPDIEGDLTEVLCGCQNLRFTHCLFIYIRVSGLHRGRCSTYCGKAKRVNLDTKSGHVLLLELTSQMALDEGGLHMMVRG